MPIRRVSLAFRAIGLTAAALSLAGCTTLTGGAPSSSFAPPAGGPSVGMQDGLAARPNSGLEAEASRSLALAAEYQALEYKGRGEAVTWQAESGESGRVVAYQPYRVGRQDCRQFSHTLTIEGEIKTLKGAACRTENGSWAVI
ncbi:hypothetical protein D8780_04240 [Notoacmeibacter ruber]|uniref:Surface antigen domain-containing protein n=2 Tax=Notoacmeibacter ruber TaxID=2670375 RepID=A0A3L7JAR6_9HYPH|nr:hypothetical protein D8780_04240 [Notoacmeibacter ruber]